MKSSAIKKPVCRARGGAHPPHSKNAMNEASAHIPLPEQVLIPMRQHIGADCIPTVQVGDTVTVGQKIGDSDAPVSAPIYSSVSGTVTAVEPRPAYSGQMVETVVITPDGQQTECADLHPVEVKTTEDLVKAARACGLVGLGGAGFPTHIKLTPKADTPLDTLIINGAECEPFITTDYRVMIEEPSLVLQGAKTLLSALPVNRVIIAIENNKPEAIKGFAQLLQDDPIEGVVVTPLPSRYPHGAEKVLVQVTTGRKVPMGALPSAVGCGVINITGVAVLQHYINTGMPLTRRRLTVDGPAVKTPKNLWVPIGTPISHVLNQVELAVPEEEIGKIIMGGPMMGIAQLNADSPVLKQNNAILVIDKKNDLSDHRQDPCIRCGRCASVCPMGLMPTLIERFAKINDIQNLTRVGVGVCMECGSCAYNCPAHRPLVQYMRLAKEIYRKGAK